MKAEDRAKAKSIAKSGEHCGSASQELKRLRLHLNFELILRNRPSPRAALGSFGPINNLKYGVKRRK